MDRKALLSTLDSSIRTSSRPYTPPREHRASQLASLRVTPAVVVLSCTRMRASHAHISRLPCNNECISGCCDATNIERIRCSSTYSLARRDSFARRTRLVAPYSSPSASSSPHSRCSFPAPVRHPRAVPRPKVKVVTVHYACSLSLSLSSHFRGVLPFASFLVTRARATLLVREASR